ncbi:hypothetical protein LX87_03815 [Larkinella arboricola]|uniref:Uncharacterized protein n=1 Tax=Larkinella arboricola TaxID=643671 RepID=A0A327WX92_LARAB|nr:hypothetical protein [Larkinella arboricola]RAJ96065.1 hypothetical protein LX87_03815 [Larkinella arboricola]
MKKGLPDFSQVIGGENGIAYAPYQGIGDVSVIPLTLQVARQDDGKPAFFLELIRGVTPFSLPKPHGMIDLRLDVGSVETSFLETVRNRWPERAMIKPSFNQGFFRFRSLSDRVDNAGADLLAPVTMGGLLVSRLRYTRLLSLEALTAIKQALQEELLVLDAFAELEVKGVAPRLPATVEFNPGDLMRTVEPLLNPGRQMPVSRLVEFFRQDRSAFPFLSIQAEGPFTEDEFGTTLADWIMARFGRFTPSPDDDPQPYWHLPESSEQGRFIWKFSDPLETSRILTFQFDALAEARKLVQMAGLNTVYTERVIPPLQTGFLRILVTHELPELPDSVLQVGVRFQAPPNPPHRLQAINKTVVFTPGQSSEVAELQFSPVERQEYSYAPFVVFRTAAGTQELTGESRLSADQHLRIRDLPVTLVAIEAATDLLNEATLHGLYQWEMAGNAKSMAFNLSASQPKTTLVVPAEVNGLPTCVVEAVAVDSDGRVQAEFYPNGSLRLDSFSFPGYGPHSVEFVGQWKEPDALIVLHCLPEEEPPEGSSPTVLTLTMDKPRKSWSWFADSMFHPGFRYRVLNGGGEELLPWSEIQSPYTGTVRVDPHQKDSEDMYDGNQLFNGLRYFKNPDEENGYYYLPEQPKPQTDPDGKPTLSLIVMGGNGFLQLGTVWEADAVTLEELRSHIANERNEPAAAIQLNFAPVEVEKVEVVLKTGSEEKVLATSSSSGYPPFSAIFSAAVTKDDQNAVVAALHQQKDVLRVDYHTVRQTDESVTVTIRGRIQQAPDGLAENASLQECKEWVVAAVASETLHMVKTGSKKASGELWQTAEEEALEAAAEQVSRYVRGTVFQADEAQINVVSEKSETASTPVIFSTDVSTWFSGNEGNSHIRIGG